MTTEQAYKNFEENLGDMSVNELKAMQRIIAQELVSRNDLILPYLKDIEKAINNIIAVGCGTCVALDYKNGEDIWTWEAVADWLVTEYREN